MTVVPIVNDRTYAQKAYDYMIEVSGIASKYMGTVDGAKDMVFKPIKLFTDIAHYNGKQSRISENVQNLAVDAGAYLDFAEIYPKMYKIAGEVSKFIGNRSYSDLFDAIIWRRDGKEFYSLADITAKVSSLAATVLKCGELLAKKGVAMWDSGLLKLWANRFNLLQFGWGMIKEADNVSSEHLDPTNTNRDTQLKTHALMKLAFHTSLFALVAFGSMLSPFTILACSTTALAASIGSEFYGKLTGLVPKSP